MLHGLFQDDEGAILSNDTCHVAVGGAAMDPRMWDESTSATVDVLRAT